MHRHYGVHTPIKHIEIPCDFNDVYLSDDKINEEILTSNIPDGWLPKKPESILLAVVKDGITTGQTMLRKFRPWAKYFDSYVLEVMENPEPWWNHDIKD